MKKKVLAVLLSCAACAILAACSGNQTDVVEEQPEVVEENIGDHAEKPEVVEEIVEETVEEPSYTEYDIDEVLSNVSEDRVWVKYTADGKQYTGLADTDGNIVYSTDLNLYDFSDVMGGVAFVDDGDHLSFIDADGNQLSQFEGEQGHLIEVIAEDGGNFLVLESTNGFDGNKHQLHIIDSTGKIVYTRELDGFTAQSVKVASVDMVKDGVFLFNIYADQFESGYNGHYGGLFGLAQLNVPNVVLYFNDCGVIGQDSPSEGFFGLSTSHNGFLFYSRDDTNQSVSIIPVTTYADDAEFENALSSGTELGWKDYFFNWQSYDGYAVFNTYTVYGADDIKVYDLNSSNTMTYPTLPDGVRISSYFYDGSYLGMACSNGYELVYMTGADGLEYYVLCDSAGNMLYDPIQNSNGLSYVIDNGYLLSKEGVVLLDGQQVGWDKIPANIDFLHDHLVRDGNGTLMYGVSDGYVLPFNEQGKAPNKFQTLDGSKEVSTVKVTE